MSNVIEKPPTSQAKRGYFGIGVEGISKAQNLGTLMRSAYAFGADFFFSIAPDLNMKDVRHSDTADASQHMPFYEFDSARELLLPKGCQLVAIELLDDAVELPSFRHPTQAAYVLGPEMGDVSPTMLERCDHVLKIPTRFCINVGVAGALVMYDRLVSTGRFDPRPVKPGGPTEKRKIHPHGHRRIDRHEKANKQ